MNANQATKEPKISPAVNGNPMLAAQPADDPGALVELHDDDEADDARPLAADDEEDEDESPAPERAAEPQALPGAPGGADPVRLYLREMGTISLLTREGELTPRAYMADNDLALGRVIDAPIPEGGEPAVRLQEAMRSAEARGDEATADEARRRFWALKTQATEKARGHRSPS